MALLMKPKITDPPNVRSVIGPLEPTTRPAFFKKSPTETCLALLNSPKEITWNVSYSLWVDTWHCFGKMLLGPRRILFRNGCMPAI